MTLRRLLATNAPEAVLLIRILVGSVFFTEGVQKFLFPAALGVGRFAKIGFSHPEVLAPLVGAFEIVCGALVIAGLVTRLAALPLTAIILTALATTKLPILETAGLWAAFHEARTDWSMLLGNLFLIAVGAGRWSMDAWILRHRSGS